MEKPLRIAQISDIHFSKIVINPFQIFSKRFIGNLNLLFFRRKLHDGNRVFTLPLLLKELGVTHVIITGDLTTTSFEKEFLLARRFINELEAVDLSTYLIPGNHDHYTKRAYKKKIFYRYFPKQFSNSFPLFNLEKHGVTADYLGNNIYLVGMDTTLATSAYYSTGYFSATVEESLTTLLQQLPKNSRIILANHFPLFQHENPRRVMNRADALQKLVKEFPSIQIYLHGHTHRRCLADLRPSSFPLILDSGSVSHETLGSFHVMDLSEKDLGIQVYSWDKDHQPHPWKVIQHDTFSMV